MTSDLTPLDLLAELTPDVPAPAQSGPPTDWLSATDKRTGAPLGTCRGCQRPIFPDTNRNRYRNGGTARRTKGRIDICSDCHQWQQRHPGQSIDTADSQASGHKVPQRRPVTGGWAWRDDAACRNAPFVLFDAPVLHNASIPPYMIAAAVVFCANCPVREACSAEADEGEYEGLFGGFLRYFTDSRKWRRYDLMAKGRDLIAKGHR